ncbi:MAG: phage minor head protein [Halothiobacillaceae bacterium]|nr:phage minor head protein [Halothiobacillaceae bacterium]
MPDARAPEVQAILRQPFAEQVAFFRSKLGALLPTARWDDLWQAEHDRAFMVAGAAQADLLADLATAVDQAIAGGETLEGFRKRFAEIVERHGWHGWTGEATAAGRAWRTRVIFETNLITSYAAGRYTQLREGGYAWWIYKHSDFVARPRPHHVALDGITRAPDDPFWQVHYPPNGWGCRCRVVGARGAAAIRRLGGDPEKPLPDWVGRVDPKTQAPVGIDPGFAYAPGASVSDTVRELAKKTVQWDYALAKAYMDSVPPAARDALALAQRGAPETAEIVRRYAERAIELRNGAPVPPPTSPYQTLGLLTSIQARKIAAVVGIAKVESELYDWALDRYAPIHIRNEHGDVAAEARRGQIAVAADDYRHLPRIIDAPDRMEDAGVTDTGRRAVELVKEIDGVSYHAVFEVLTKRRMLALKTLYKKAGRPPVLRP